MLRSMYSAVSGLKAHQAEMDVIGNNIANVNTVGFKASRMTFKEIFNQTIKGASAPQGNGGGTNPQQVGLGVAIASIDTLFTNGGSQRTDNPTDLSIDGNGFFIVNNGGANLYTRAGNFSFDSNGDLVTPDGYKVMGWISQDGKTVNTDTGNLSPISIKDWSSTSPSSTTLIQLGGNLDAGTSIGSSVSYNVTIYDSQGGSHVATIQFTKKISAGNWDVSITNFDGTDLSSPVNIGSIKFDSAGLIDQTNPSSFTVSSSSLLGANTNTNATLGDGTNNITIDLSKLTMYSNPTDLRELSKDGNSAGSIENINIDQYGVVSGIYSNGRTQVIGQIALADFQNTQGLEKVGNTMFINTVNSGDPMIGAANTGTRGTINPGTLEMSNVDLANEFANMITTQRGFEANSKVITTSDEILQDLVNLKR
ncbi:flagellar basal-body rod protein FlgF [Thermoanaerobacterium thermosaccharolyticum]|uniref:flagellar basal-body rod protein FlgF n=1 Tax=Thermoanaerobacterium thermosaccharolyticum TaxID=1517 RepID=UPI00178147AA|nr:flagellar basal-body rod protein FlgF [Thermoanaerobacterium thermosaccharolyticum]MBE0068024.1 flagellar basal-body rod protein FlgF [Thermoanaerobacterium thermosaccharolyticum]MBE0227768.1 flagellar basal-body rod protein FlgF [Thermoanaerobacterium thermosaccharolyticum]